MPAIWNDFRELFGQLPPVRRLTAEIENLQHERDALIAQRDALTVERDEQAAHAARLYTETEEIRQREQLLLAEREALIAERDGQRQHAERLQRERDEAQRLWELERATLQTELRTKTRLVWAPPGHYYSPIVNPEDEYTRRALRQPQGGPAAIRLDPERMMAVFDRVAEHYAELPFTRQRTAGLRFYFENPAFSYADAITLSGMLLTFHPKRLIEAGSGFSSCVIMDVNERFFKGAMHATFLDPSPEALFSLLEADDPYGDHVKAMALQDAPLEWFTKLAENDVFFIDSSHVAKTGSDVNDYFFRILPALAPGVLVHIHDVLYPFRYPEEWTLQENRSWNEAYMLRAFLEYNDQFEVIYWNDLVYRTYEERTRERMPLCLEHTGCSIWLRKTKGQAEPPAPPLFDR